MTAIGDTPDSSSDETGAFEDTFSDLIQFEDDAPLAEVQIASEMAAMSMHEREKVYHDIHGVSGKVEETPNLLRENLQELETELLSNSHDDDHAYKAAFNQNTSYVRNPTFLLRFLRADRFDVKAATKRILSHFHWKQQLFGDALLTKEIVQSDLGPLDVDTLYNWPLYVLPVKDPAGRPVVIYKGVDPKFETRYILRKCFYLSMVLSEDMETQSKGCVFLSYMVGQTFCFSEFAKRREVNQAFGQIVGSMPIRFDVVHFCSDSNLWRPFVAIFKLSTCMSQRVRCREHYGNHKEVRFSLQTFGIPMEFVEVSVASSEANSRFWKKRNEFERQRLLLTANKKKSASSSVVELPNRLDVLLGRGSACYNHFGNVRLRNLIEEYSDRYNTSRVLAKTRLSGEIVRQIKLTGRFLRDCGYGWVEVDDEAAHKKVAHAFRTLRGLTNKVPLFSSDTSTNVDTTGSSLSTVEREEGSTRRKRVRGGSD